MSETAKLILKTAVPVAIGLAVVFWLFGNEFSPSQFSQIPWTTRTIAALLLACICMAGRESGMMWRLRVLTDRHLTWGASLKVTMMCEFTSAITPTTAGGSALSMIFLNREGISLGRSTTLTLVTLMLDELFLAVMCPLLFLFVPYGSLLGFDTSDFDTGITTAFWIVYAGICLVTLLLYLGVFVAPGRIAAALGLLFRLPGLRRWHSKVEDMGQTMVHAGKDLRARSFMWWLRAFGATAMTWICRFLVVNALFWGFAELAPQLVVLGRQFVVWTLLTVSPTPGGSGLSEWLFAHYYGDLITPASMVAVIAILWRVITYYVYLLAGIILIPHWLKKKTAE